MESQFKPDEILSAPAKGSGREVIRCAHCQLNQFVTANEKCRRCREPLREAVVVAEAPSPKVLCPAIVGLDAGMAFMVKLMRVAFDLSQRDMARLIGCPRTYISKLERGHALPNIKSIDRLCAALDISVYGFMTLLDGVSA